MTKPTYLRTVNWTYIHIKRAFSNHADLVLTLSSYCTHNNVSLSLTSNQLWPATVLIQQQLWYLMTRCHSLTQAITYGLCRPISPTILLWFHFWFFSKLVIVNASFRWSRHSTLLIRELLRWLLKVLCHIYLSVYTL